MLMLLTLLTIIIMKSATNTNKNYAFFEEKIEEATSGLALRHL